MAAPSRICKSGVSALLLTAWFISSVPTLLPAAEDPPRDAGRSEAVGESSSRPAVYGPEVVAKADRILADAGLKRSGKTVLASQTAELSKSLSALSRSRRTLKQLADAANSTEQQLHQIRQQAQVIDRQNGEFNLRLAQPAIDVATNNRLVGLINANNTRLRQLEEQRKQLQEKLLRQRGELNEAEAKYAETAVALRRDFSEVLDNIQEKLQDSQVQISLKVWHVNFGTPETVDPLSLLGPLDRRIKQVEQEIFREAIPLERRQGGLFVSAAVNDNTVSMIVDSGSSLVILPAETAAEMGITPSEDARRLRLVLADGTEISASAVVLDSVRVGGFEASGVEAGILEPNAYAAKPILGLSFLSRYRFEIDSSTATLKLVRVGDD